MEAQEGRHSGGYVLDEVRQIVQSRIDIELSQVHHMVSIVIPVLNEAHVLEKSVRTLLRFFEERPFGVSALSEYLSYGDWRTAFARNSVYARYSPRPKRRFKSVRKFSYGAFLKRIDDGTGRRVFQDDFARAFRGADEVVIASVFRSSLPVEERLSESELVRDLTAAGTHARHLPDVDSIVSAVAGEARAGDLVVVMSNGGPESAFRLTRSLICSGLSVSLEKANQMTGKASASTLAMTGSSIACGKRLRTREVRSRTSAAAPSGSRSSRNRTVIWLRSAREMDVITSMPSMPAMESSSGLVTADSTISLEAPR